MSAVTANMIMGNNDAAQNGVISKYIFDIFSQSCFDTSALTFATH